MAHHIDTFPGREISIDGQPHLYFGGTSYLGLQTDTAFQEVFVQNIKKYGTNYGASRKSNVRFTIFEKTERYLADLVGSEACTTLSSGYLAGQFVAQTLNTKARRFFYAPNTHSALYQSRVKPYTTFTALNIAVRAHLNSKKNTVTPVVFLDAIDFSGCNYPDFDPLRLLPLNRIILVVDDSHGIGIIGENGGGVYRSLSKLDAKELLVCCSLGKGFGIQAGAIFGLKKRIDSFNNTAFFGGASPASPAAIATLLDTSDILSKKRTILENNIDFFLNDLKNPEKFSFMKNHPTFSFVDNQLIEFLALHKIIVTSFAYPDTDAQLMSRIVLSAVHKKEDIEKLSGLLNEVRF